MEQKKLYTISLNFDRDKHKDLIEWLKKTAEEKEHSLSSLCISLLKSFYKKETNDGNNE